MPRIISQDRGLGWCKCLREDIRKHALCAGKKRAVRELLVIQKKGWESWAAAPVPRQTLGNSCNISLP